MLLNNNVCWKERKPTCSLSCFHTLLLLESRRPRSWRGRLSRPCQRWERLEILQPDANLIFKPELVLLKTTGASQLSQRSDSSPVVTQAEQLARN